MLKMGHQPIARTPREILGLPGVSPRIKSRPGTMGPVQKIPVPRLLHLYSSPVSSGILLIEHESSVRSIHFQNGRIIWAESSDEHFRFSQWLVDTELAHGVAIDGATNLVRSGVCRFGDALERSGAMSASAVADAADQFITDVVSSAFPWRDGEFEFQPLRTTIPFDPPVQTRAPIQVEQIIIEGFSALEDVSLAASWLGDLSSQRSFASDPFRYFVGQRFSQGHVALLARLSIGCFSVLEAMNLGACEPEEALRLLGALDALGELVEV